VRFAAASLRVREPRRGLELRVERLSNIDAQLVEIVEQPPFA